MDTSEDKNLIENIRAWPNKVVLCMKRRSRTMGEWPEFGILVFDDNKTVIKASIDQIMTMTPEEVVAVPRETFDSVDAMLAAGWVVD